MTTVLFTSLDILLGIQDVEFVKRALSWGMRGIAPAPPTVKEEAGQGLGFWWQHSQGVLLQSTHRVT